MISVLLVFTSVYETEATFGVLRFFSSHNGYLQLQSNSVNTDTEGAIESVSCIKQVEFKEKCKGILSLETKQTVRNYDVSGKAGFDCSKFCQVYFVV